MNETTNRTENDRDWPSRVSFDDAGFPKGVVTVILLGGILAGLAAAIWHLALGAQ